MSSDHPLAGLREDQLSPGFTLAGGAAIITFKLMRIGRLISAIWLFSLGGLLVSQPSTPGRFHRFERLTFQAGTAEEIGISSILQDEEGFLWLGTSTGLARYDGNRLVFFYPQSGQHIPAEDVGIYPVTIDRTGDIWFGTFGLGLFRFSRQTGELLNYRHRAGEAASLSDDNVMAVQEDLQGNLWVGTRTGGLNLFDRASETFRRVPLGPGTEVIWEVFADSRGAIWVGTLEAGLFRIDPVSGDARNYRFRADDPGSLGSDMVWTVFEDVAGIIWVGTKNGGLDRYVPETDTFVRFYGGRDYPQDLASQTITAITEDRSGRLWLGTASDGLRIWDRRTGDYRICRHDPQDRETLGDNNVTSLFRDMTGIIWVGTVGSGLNKFLADQVKFPHFKHDASDPRSIGHNDVRALWADGPGALWVGTITGLERLDLATGRVIRRLFAPDPDSIDASIAPVTALAGDTEGRIWIGTESAGLLRYDPLAERLVPFRQERDNANSLSHNRVNTLRVDKERPDVLWAGTQRGLSRLDTRSGRWTRFFNDPADAASLSGNIITAIEESERGFLWIGTTSGLNRMEKATGRCETFISRFGAPPGTGLSSNAVTCLLSGRDGSLWIGTENGLNRFDRALGRWRSLAQKDGLAGTVVCGLLEDTDGALWVSTNRGLSRFDASSDRFTSFGLHDGLQGLTFNRGACFGSPDGRLYFGGANGYNAFDPGEVRKDPFVPPVAWTGFYRNNREVRLPPSRFARREMSLTYKTGLATFEFAALVFTAPELNTFAYRLEPRDAEWISLIPEHQVSLYNLGAGRYTLRVKASNPDGVWNEEGVAIDLIVLPPFWKTWWFLLITAAFALSGILLALRTWRRIKSSPASLGRDPSGAIEALDLTAREREILLLVLKGASNKDIGQKLFISASTVRNHISNIYQKLGVRNRLELINRIGRDARGSSQPERP